MTEKSAKADDKAAEELEQLRAEVERLTKDLADAKAMIAEDAQGDAPEGIRETAEDFAEDLSERAQEGWKELQQQISDHPVPSAFIALGIGFVLARLLSR
ncbi:MAG: hypothetical protein WA943_00175 [Parvibaculum sp.]|jgi:ElaB/YqjD/DUF883 family membrane-anchored ribosome-binding protein|uniref:DUF883 family protein n=1 Tax=Parvibaculum sp. TaxID=2024848 RepID=UPI003C7527E0